MKEHISQRKNLNSSTNKYPSAEVLQLACYDDYYRIINTYDKIYDKVNISLAFCGIVLLVIFNSFDYTQFLKITSLASIFKSLSVLTLLLCSATSIVCMICAVIQLLLLMRSRTITVFDSIAVRNDEIYRWLPDEAALWLIDKYTIAVNELRSVISDKQRKYNSAIIKIVISILTYSVVQIIEKGV